MKIVFTTNTSYSVADLIGFSGTENMGYDDSFNSCALLSVKENSQEKLYLSGVLQNYTHRKPLLNDNPRWQTAWSGFDYYLLGNKDGRDRWEYQGAENGFLKQQLLMPMPNAQIVSVEGTYGFFSGPKALEEYGSLKDSWVKRMLPIYESLKDQRLLPPDNGHGASCWCAEQWKFAHRCGPFDRVYSDKRDWKFDPTPWEGPRVKEIDCQYGVTINDPGYMVVLLDWGGHKPNLSPYNLEEAGLIPIFNERTCCDNHALITHWFKVRHGSPIKVGDLIPKW